MPLVSERHKIIYFNVPKVASTTLKAAWYEIVNNRPPPPLDAANDLHWEVFSPPVRDIDAFLNRRGYWSFAVVRDPIDRLLSAYTNRVEFYRVPETAKLGRLRAALLGVPVRPDIDTFFRKLERYRLQSGDIRRHTLPMSSFLGPDLRRIDFVVPIERLADLQPELRRRTGLNLTFQRFQTGGRKLRREDLPRATFELVMRHARRDYELVRDFYPMPEAVG